MAFILLVIIVFMAVLIFSLNNTGTEKNTTTTPHSQTEHKILIATQQSYFRDSVTTILKNNFQKQNIPVQLIDIYSLPEVEPKEYSVVIVIHKWHTWSAPEVVNKFINRTKAQSEKIIIMTTSSDGTYGPENVDAITGASKMEDAEMYANKIIDRTAALMNKDN